MVEEPDPRLIRLVQDLDKERQERIRLRRVAGALKLQNERLQRRVQQLTMDRAHLSNAVTRAKRA
jgi:hypothetical protein